MTRPRPKMIRQGDVLLRPFPPEATWDHALNPSVGWIVSEDKTRVREDGVVLAFGEVTGHAHVAKGSTKPDGRKRPTVQLYRQAAGWRRTRDGRQQFISRPREAIRVNRSTTVEHEEHGTLKLAAGTYEVVHQREYRPGMSAAVGEQISTPRSAWVRD